MSLHTVLFHSFLVGVVWWEKRGCTIDVHILVLSIWVWLMKESQRCWLTAENHRGFAVVQLLSHVQLFVTFWAAACQASLSFTISWSLLRLMSIESVMPSNHLTFCCPLLFLPKVFPSLRIFSNESGLSIKWPKFWSFRFSISHSNEYSGLILFTIDWFDLLVVQGTLRSPL